MHNHDKIRSAFVDLPARREINRERERKRLTPHGRMNEIASSRSFVERDQRWSGSVGGVVFHRRE